MRRTAKGKGAEAWLRANSAPLIGEFRLQRWRLDDTQSVL
jgi:hypothetical protein